MARIHPDAQWLPTVWSSGGTLRGERAIRAWFEQFGPRLEHLRIDVAEIIGGTGWIVVLGVVHDTRAGTDFSVMVGWTFAVAGGQVVEGRAFTSWEEARAAAGLGQPLPAPGEAEGS